MNKIIKLRNPKNKFESINYSNANSITKSLKARNIEFGENIFWGDNVQVDDNVHIGKGAKIGNNVSIADGIRIGALAKIGDSVNLHKGYYVQGSKDCVTYVGNSMLSIGCLTYPIEGWLKSFSLLGRAEGYSAEEMGEYFTYIQEAEEFHETFYKTV